MSGGSMDYLYFKVEEARFEDNTVLRKAFRKHLMLVAKALHDIEWEDSGDYGEGDADEAIRAVVSPQEVLAVSTEDARRALEDLRAALAELEEKR